AHFAVVFHPRWQIHVNGDQLQKVAAIGGLQIGIVSQLALYATSGVEVTDYKFDNAGLAVPFAGGLVISPRRVFDLGVEFSMPDVSDGGGGDDRWLTAWFAVRR